ncbi:MAG: tRNA (adenosine(37)-N6)-dimethylallyltransferase MiaA [Clostridiaceae bacterium]|uniref:tRNA (adenosine(37)-N6)-dimethylallyltransferase MiaA n=1 Tax=Clostridium TaxID=1485 RepID=UPI00258F0115|nr:tRNA (adenosine(37)-N6)-dimethylallyltransferase MiaA [Clostridium sp.]MCI6140124.1 tRNA (adenosine(37)-N6)-dimethylallyltransferase MiaA [Clostridium sp.]MDY3230875.1 tRNA (adenosine(37)-N6)-dimethylallyltransferase MiaA [Clostridiaceae bacterium]
MKQPLIILTGPTAVGKTDLSIKLAGAIDGEIISADSMQVYRHMDIGSAKVTREEMGGIPHYLIDVLEPDQEFNVVSFQSMAKKALKEIYSHGHIPIIAGGTGFYIQALLYDIDFTENDGDSSIRRELEALAVSEGEQAPLILHSMLQKADPKAAADIHPNNIKRVIRAIEYFRQTGERISLHNERAHAKESPYNFLYYVVTTERDQLYRRIENRVDRMLEQGLVEEVQRLKAMGCHRGQTSMQGLGYKEILDYLNGECSLDEAIYRLKRDTRHFAKRQLTWFKRERDVHWLHLPDFQGDLSLVLERMIEDCINQGIVIQ